MLGRRRFAQSLADLIINAPSGSSLKIGVFGERGEGKTSILQLVRQILEGEGYICAWLVPWVTENRGEIAQQLTLQIAEKLGVNLRRLKAATQVETLARKARKLAQDDTKLRVFEALVGPAIPRLIGTFVNRQGEALSQAITDALGSRACYHRFVFSKRRHAVAIGQALVVVFFWATFFIVIKYLLRAIPPVTLAGLRYLFAFLMLSAYTLLIDGKKPSPLPWATLAVIGVLQFGVAQALQNVALQLLPVATFALLFSLLPILVAGMEKVSLGEVPNAAQIGGAAITVAGIALYLPGSSAIVWWKTLPLFGALIAIAVATILTRRITREGKAPTLFLTLVSMGAGWLFILPIGSVIEPRASFSPAILSSLLVFSLATALTFYLWNHILRTLTAFEVNVIGNTLIFQVGILGWIFFGETLTSQQIAAMALASGGLLLVQMQTLKGVGSSAVPEKKF